MLRHFVFLGFEMEGTGLPNIWYVSIAGPLIEHRFNFNQNIHTP
jgi:hypothetical protein